MKKRWNNQAKDYRNAIHYIRGRQQGTIKSFRTPWPKINFAGIDGFEWNTLTTIAGPSGCYKSTMVDQIAREANTCNPSSYFRVLMFQLEMPGRMSKVREFSAILGKNYQAICSADGTIISNAEIDKVIDYSTKQVKVNQNIDIVSELLTPSEFYETIINYMEAHAETDEKTGIKKYIDTVVTLDHAYLLKCDGPQAKVNMLYEFAEIIVELKKAYPIAFIILNQIQKNMEAPERRKNGAMENYPTRDDIFGGDAMYQASDILIALDCPAKRRIDFYGPERYIINGDTKLVAVHLIKVRNGEPGMTFFKAVPEKMGLVETDVPPRQERN